jgi:molybdenum cofactor synthesis domain-containing protein
MSNERIKVLSVHRSSQKGAEKKAVDFLEVGEKGVLGDGDMPFWNYELSMLGDLAYANQDARYGHWRENLTVKGMDLTRLNPMDELDSGDLRLRVTITARNVKSDQLVRFNPGRAKDIPLGGLFVRPLNSGRVYPGMTFNYRPKVFSIRILTLSDRASEGIYEDKSGVLIGEMATAYFESTGRLSQVNRTVIPDDRDTLETHFLEAVESGVDILFTTGGTGIGRRDITPDVIRPLLDKEIPGIMELIRVKYGMQKPNALVSRSIAGVKEGTLIYCLPGSSKGVRESMTEILPTLFHSMYMLNDIQLH